MRPLLAVILFLAFNFPVEAEEKSTNTIARYDAEIPYELGVPIKFADIVVTYKEDVLEPGHDKIASQVFEISSGSETKQITVPLLSMSVPIVRFGIHFYRLNVHQGHKVLIVKEGIW